MVNHLSLAPCVTSSGLTLYWKRSSDTASPTKTMLESVLTPSHPHTLTPSLFSQFLELDFLPNPPRGCSYFYGYSALKPFLESQQLLGIIRAHQCKEEVGGVDHTHQPHPLINCSLRGCVTRTLTTEKMCSLFLTLPPSSPPPTTVVPMATRGQS